MKEKYIFQIHNDSSESLVENEIGTSYATSIDVKKVSLILFLKTYKKGQNKSGTGILALLVFQYYQIQCLRATKIII